MISIGAVIGGPERSVLEARVLNLMGYCEDNRYDRTESAVVNIVYHVPGAILKLDYVGLRTAKFSRKEKIQMIQIGVEEEWIRSSDEKKVLRYVYETADAALSLAKSEFDRRGIVYDLEDDKRFLERWKQASSTPTTG